MVTFRNSLVCRSLRREAERGGIPLVFDDSERAHSRWTVVYMNGGNNSLETTVSINVTFSVDEDWEEFIARVGVKLNMMPLDCTPFSHSRPKKPFRVLISTPDVTAQSPIGRCRAEVETWTRRMRLYTIDGVEILSLRTTEFASPVFLVGAGDHFVWPGVHVGYRRTVRNALVPTSDGDAPVELITLALEPRLFFIPRFVSDEEADMIAAHATPTLRRSYVFENAKSVEIEARTSEQAWLLCRTDGTAAERAICTLDQRVADTTRVPLAHIVRASDSLQVVHYGPGQHYRTLRTGVSLSLSRAASVDSHHDYFDPTLSPDHRAGRDGVQRLLTLFWYLNDVDEGGETAFPRAGDTGYGRGSILNMADCSRGVRVKPKKGSAVLWYNVLAAGNGHECLLDSMSLHGGCDVLKGEKYGANKWIYNRVHGGSDLPYYYRNATRNEDVVV
jgi:hypothetical protein